MQFDALANVKPSVFNWLAIGLMALTFIVFAKWLLTRYPVAGLSDIVNMA